MDPTETTAAVEFNDARGARAGPPRGGDRARPDRAPLTNIGIVLPEPGFHDALRDLTRATGTLLLIDETHTLSAGPGGYTAAHGLQPDLSDDRQGDRRRCAGRGLRNDSEEVAGRIAGQLDADYEDTGGVGGTLAGNALSAAAVRATLDQVLTAEAFERMIELAGSFTEGVRRVIDENDLPWHVVQLGARAEYGFLPEPPTSGGQAAASSDPELEEYLHPFCLNRGVLITPFHNMALMSPATQREDVERHTEVFAEACELLVTA